MPPSEPVRAAPVRLPSVFFGWIDRDGSVYRYDGRRETPVGKPVGTWRAANASGRTCIVMQLGPQRWISLLDWAPFSAEENAARDGMVVLFRQDPAAAARARRAA